MSSYLHGQQTRTLAADMLKRILIVDDNPLYVDLVKEVFSHTNAAVVSANDGHSALSILASGVVDLIISDVDMPGMDGLAFHSQLSSNSIFSKIPFVFLTGSTDGKVLEYINKEPNVRLISKSNLLTDLRALASTVQ
jgi:CheY-like chemotaxis protein